MCFVHVVCANVAGWVTSGVSYTELRCLPHTAKLAIGHGFFAHTGGTALYVLMPQFCKKRLPSARIREGYCSCLVCLSVCLSVCLCVYLSVPALAASASVETTKQQYSQVFLLDFDSWIFEKNLPYKGFGVKKPYANESHREPFSRTFRTSEGQQLCEGRLVGLMLLQRLATGVTGVKQARSG